MDASPQHRNPSGQRPRRKFAGRWLLMVLWLSTSAVSLATAESPRWIFPEQRRIVVRSPTQLPHAPLPAASPPRTVSDPSTAEPWELSLDDAIRVALENAKVIRVLAGLSAVSSGSTIYDPAVANNAIDEQRARFDPLLSIDNVFNRTEIPTANFDPLNPGQSTISGLRTDSYDFTSSLSQTNVFGGTSALSVGSTTARLRPGVFPLNPQERSNVELGYTQPIWQGHGVAANMAPMVIARINTERSFFQFKASVQELVRSVIEAYWDLVFARADRWARQQQVDQAEFAYRRAEKRKEGGFANQGEVAQTRVAFANFRAALIAAESAVLDREAVLRNLLGLPPSDSRELVPVTYPLTERLPSDWNTLMMLAEERRPDVIELKLILEADRQQLVIAKNQTQPRLDAIASYRWNGLEGLMPNNSVLSTAGSDFTDWTLGVNFSVPLGLRATRARLRSQELIVARDQINLQQGVHAAVHNVAGVVRSQASTYERYLAFKEMRMAAKLNLEQQFADFKADRVNFINVFQAIGDWGNAVSAEAAALTLYNVTLASLETETGTILETHGITFVEERFGSLGPGAIFGDRCRPPYECYPYAEPPTLNRERYRVDGHPAEESFDLHPPYDTSADPGATEDDPE